MLKKSFGAKGLSDVQKIIGTHSSQSYSTFLKCALFSFTNEMIRKSAGSFVNLDTLMYKMNNIPIESTIDLTKNSINNNSININQLVPDGIYYKVGKDVIKVEGLTKNEDGTYNVGLTNVTSPNQEYYSIPKTIKNLYDL